MLSRDASVRNYLYQLTFRYNNVNLSSDGSGIQEFFYFGIRNLDLESQILRFRNPTKIWNSESTWGIKKAISAIQNRIQTGTNLQFLPLSHLVYWYVSIYNRKKMKANQVAVLAVCFVMIQGGHCKGWEKDLTQPVII